VEDLTALTETTAYGTKNNFLQFLKNSSSKAERLPQKEKLQYGMEIQNLDDSSISNSLSVSSLFIFLFNSSSYFLSLSFIFSCKQRHISNTKKVKIIKYEKAKGFQIIQLNLVTNLHTVHNIETEDASDDCARHDSNVAPSLRRHRHRFNSATAAEKVVR
jgi:hypothetical protein